MNRYQVIYSTDSSGSYTNFPAASDEAAWVQADERAYGARIVSLVEVVTGNPDHTRKLVRPTPADYDHLFHTFLGLPPDKGDKPLCGADLPDIWDWAGPRPACPACEALRVAS